MRRGGKSGELKGELELQGNSLAASRAPATWVSRGCFGAPLITGEGAPAYPIHTWTLGGSPLPQPLALPRKSEAAGGTLCGPSLAWRRSGPHYLPRLVADSQQLGRDHAALLSRTIWNRGQLRTVGG